MYYVGIDLGGTNTKIGIGDTKGNLFVSDSIKTESIKGIDYILNKIWIKIQEMSNLININISDIKGIGVGIPGPVENQSIVGFFSNFTWDKGINLKEKFEQVTGIETLLDNDVNVIAKGEVIFGAAKNSSSSITIAVGTGIGGGIFVNNKLISGVKGSAGEIGHMKVAVNGKLCGCGQNGCFEAYASATGLVREAISRLAVNKKNMLFQKYQNDISKIEAKDIFDCAKLGDKFSQELLDYESEWLACGIGSLLNIINPEVVVLCGGIIQGGDFFIEDIKNKLKKYALPIALEKLKFVKGELGNDAGIKGAITLFM